MVSSKPSAHLTSIDIFSGCGGLSEGMHKAGFDTKVAIEVDSIAASTFQLNHPATKVIKKDVRAVSGTEIRKELGRGTLHLLAGCPPCQGFSSVRRLNRRAPIEDERNDLLNEYVRLVVELKPLTLMLENVAGLIGFELFNNAIETLQDVGYNWLDYDVVNVRDYGVPQRRRRLVLVGSRLGPIRVAKPEVPRKTVRQTIEDLPLPSESNDPLHKIFPTHTPRIQERIELTPENGGSRGDLPPSYTLECHTDSKIGFHDIYGRLRWDDQSSTITGGCLNPSKGRFLHPTQHRCISAREAALLQTFPPTYKFPTDISRASLALMIGNALPPDFSYLQSKQIHDHLVQHQKTKLASAV